jgi:hypothetical protein
MRLMEQMLQSLPKSSALPGCMMFRPTGFVTMTLWPVLFFSLSHPLSLFAFCAKP